jgi:isoaspartyl peptidase/L-asparaginase-like protein (Ntn-hydrolase superfamily)
MLDHTRRSATEAAVDSAESPQVPARRAACRDILGVVALSALPHAAAGCASSATAEKHERRPAGDRTPMPTIVSTWNHGLPANEAGLDILARGGAAIDAVEAAGRVVETDCPDRTVGLGGMPDRDGFVTLDAAVMTDDNRAGSVVFVRGVAHPVSLARLVMERTPHVMLAGDGARDFARSQGIEVLPDARSPEADRAWREWLRERQYAPKVNVENHDTISILALDAAGRVAAASTTSGLAFKMHGRIADSPVIGAGIYVEPKVGGAVCTGLGEMVLRTLGAFVATDAMRRGASPQDACEEAIERIVVKNGIDPSTYQVGMLALGHDGRVGAFAVQKGFNYAVGRLDGPSRTNELLDARCKLR